MPYDVHDVARWILYKATAQGIALTHMQLQKVLYYCQGEYLGATGEPLFFAAIEAWTHGPVVPEVYQEYKRNGKSRLPTPEGAAPPQEIEKFIEHVVRKEAHKTASVLRQQTHREPPFLEAEEEGLSEISIESMKEYFSSLVWTSDEEDFFEPQFDTEAEELCSFAESFSEEDLNAIFGSR